MRLLTRCSGTLEELSASDSVFQVASLSKPVFAYAVLKLVQQGHLALDAPVLQYLPQGYRHAFDPLHPGLAAKSDAVTDPRLGAVTVRMLLQHTAGLPNWASGPLRFEGTPGKRWAYSGEGYVLLQRAVEAVMRRPLDEVMLLREPALLATTVDSPVDVDTRLNLGWGLGWGLEQSADGVHLWQWGNNPGVLDALCKVLRVCL